MIVASANPRPSVSQFHGPDHPHTYHRKERSDS